MCVVFLTVGLLVLNGNAAMFCSNLSASWFGSGSNLHSCLNTVKTKELKSAKIRIFLKIQVSCYS